MCVGGERIGNLFILGELIRIEVGISNLFIERGGYVYGGNVMCNFFFLCRVFIICFIICFIIYDYFK